MAQVKISDMTALSAAVANGDLIEVETAGGDSRKATGQEVRKWPVGVGPEITEGSNAAMGTATLVAGTVTVSNTLVTANSRVFLTGQNAGTAQGSLYISARSAGVSFTITSTNASDDRSVAYMIVEPG